MNVPSTNLPPCPMRYDPATTKEKKPSLGGFSRKAPERRPSPVHCHLASCYVNCCCHHDIREKRPEFFLCHFFGESQIQFFQQPVFLLLKIIFISYYRRCPINKSFQMVSEVGVKSPNNFRASPSSLSHFVTRMSHSSPLSDFLISLQFQYLSSKD